MVLSFPLFPFLFLVCSKRELSCTCMPCFHVYNVHVYKYMYIYMYLHYCQVRERLRAAQERNMFLEDEVMLANQEVGRGGRCGEEESECHAHNACVYTRGSLFFLEK